MEHKIFRNNICFNIFIISISLIFSQCSKTSRTIDNSEADFGCDTKVVQQIVSNQAATLIYVPAQSQWMASMNLPGSVAIACEFCASNVSQLNGLINGRSQSEIIPVTVSGKIVKRFDGQRNVSACTDGQYREVFLLQASDIR